MHVAEDVASAPPEELWAIREALSETLSRPELVRPTTSDMVLLAHWRQAMDDVCWTRGSEEALGTFVNSRAQEWPSVEERPSPEDGRVPGCGELSFSGARAKSLWRGIDVQDAGE